MIKRKKEFESKKNWKEKKKNVSESEADQFYMIFLKINQTYN